ncbi:mitochondral 37S ribosomal protein S27 [Ascosphaera aggregata]|nr:mitochondral 37S ribosomal protein S27 [Ascosphaera aggregata]
MVVPRNLLLRLQETQCRIFEATFNPRNRRLGNKILRQRLRGPALAAYYPRKTVSFRDLQDLYRPLGLETVDEEEAERLERVEYAKSRGKGKPTKKTEADTKPKKRKK